MFCFKISVLKFINAEPWWDTLTQCLGWVNKLAKLMCSILSTYGYNTVVMKVTDLRALYDTVRQD